MKKLAILVFAVISLAGCTAPDSTRKALQKAGYHDVHITGFRFWGCFKTEFHTGFEAKTADNHMVTGVACTYWPWGTTLSVD